MDLIAQSCLNSWLVFMIYEYARVSLQPSTHHGFKAHLKTKPNSSKVRCYWVGDFIPLELVFPCGNRKHVKVGKIQFFPKGWFLQHSTRQRRAVWPTGKP
jgi:hypothetical protein